MSRWTYFGQRLLLSIPVVLFGTTITFMAVRLGPIDPAGAALGSQARPEDYARFREKVGLNDPLWEQYFDFIVDMLTFDLGQSWVVHPNTPAYELIVEFGPRTIWLGFWAVLIPLFIGIPLGFYAGLNPNSWGDYVASLGGIMWLAMPNFWLAVILMMVLSQGPIFGIDWKTDVLVETSQVIGAPPLENLMDTHGFMVAFKRILPASIVLGSSSMGNEMRIGRTATLENKNANYVEMAKAKGVSSRLVVWKHIFRNALIPLIPVITAEAGILIGGSVLVETVFAINGMGVLFLKAIQEADLPLVGGLMYVFILLLVITNIVQDFLYTLIDPRVGYEGEG